MGCWIGERKDAVVRRGTTWRVERREVGSGVLQRARCRRMFSRDMTLLEVGWIEDA